MTVSSTYRGWLRRDVICDTVDTRDLVRNARRDLPQYLGWEHEPVRGHEVFTLNRAKSDDLFIGALVTLYTDGMYRQQHCKRLADLLVQTGCTDFFDVDFVGMLQDAHLLARYRPENTDREPRAGEGVALYEMGGDGKQAAECANLICTSQN